MDEDPKQHDFDQRHDGPFDQPRPSITIPPADHTAASSFPASASAAVNPATPTSPANATPQKSYTAPLADAPSPSTKKHTEAAPRKSVQLPATTPSHEDIHGPVGRKSTTMSRPRQSRDFDVRRDGPYGRPSLTMSRRRSSGGNVLDNSTLRDDAGSIIADPTAEEAPTVEQLISLEISGTGFEPEPPALNYSLWARKWSIILFWSLIVIDCVAMPVALYFGLWYGTNLSPNIVFSIVTAALGGVSIVEYILRFWRLFKHGSTCRVIGARRMYLDWFHWNFSLGWAIIMIELIIGTVPENPPIRLLAMPVTSMMYAFGTELLVVDALRYFEIPAPVRISSIPRGAQLRPAIYSIIEDVCAVDGSGGTAFREALNRRYEASHVFRAMLRHLGAFWAFGAQGMAVLCTILIFTLGSGEAAYVVGWSAPFVWAGIWTLVTYFWVKSSLRKERRAWADEIVEKRDEILAGSGASGSGSGSGTGSGSANVNADGKINGVVGEGGGGDGGGKAGDVSPRNVSTA